jgi:hypothetical protein
MWKLAMQVIMMIHPPMETLMLTMEWAARLERYESWSSLLLTGALHCVTPANAVFAVFL